MRTARPLKAGEKSMSTGLSTSGIRTIVGVDGSPQSQQAGATADPGCCGHYADLGIMPTRRRELLAAALRAAERSA
jgi:hypothetical protein